MATREEHLEWCKRRAREYMNDGKLAHAAASMVSDLGKHPETVQVIAPLAPLGLHFAEMNDFDGMRRWIEGFR